MDTRTLPLKNWLAYCTCICIGGLGILFPEPSLGQRTTTTSPIVGLRTIDQSPVLLSGGIVVADPKSAPAKKDVLIRGNTIVQVADHIDAPAGTQRIDVSGKQIYAGLIDAMREITISETGSKQPAGKDGSGYWNKNITPEIHASAASAQPDPKLEKLRSQGITVQLLAPSGGIVKGTSCAVLLVDPKHSQRLLKENIFQHATLTVPRGKSRDRYPNSPMGATALLRQVFYDAMWYRDARRARELHPSLPRPEPNTALDLLSTAMASGTFVFDTANERMAGRAADIAGEFSLLMVLRGSGLEYREIDQIAAAESVVLLPINFPKPPSTLTAEVIRKTPLRDWMHWHFAPENPSRLEKANVSFCLTTDAMDDPKLFLKHVRAAVDRGLSTEGALAALTTTPAKVLGVDESVGRVDTGMLANLVITDGDLFAEETKVIETWVAGERFIVEKNHDQKEDVLVGKWKIDLPLQETMKAAQLVLQKKKRELTGEISLISTKADDDKKEAIDENIKESTSKSSAELKQIIRQRERLTASVSLAELGSEFPAGVYQISILTVTSSDEGSAEPSLFASLVFPDGVSHKIEIARIEEGDVSKASPKKVKEKKSKEGSLAANPVAADAEITDAEITDAGITDAEIDLVVPFGAYGLTKQPARPEAVLFRGATVWTSGPEGKLVNGDVLVKEGVIAAVGGGLKVDDQCKIIDCEGRHITPGLIDCHSHAATDGGINESGQAVTAEVRIGDFIDNTDISIYRQLAGGVTTANILHGSANPIGGQSQTIKLRWGESMDAMKLEGASPGIKFALGENVKRSSERYPNTRMGVEQILRDQFLAARQYQADRAQWESGDRDRLPPRRDLQLDALVEVQNGQRWVHCHSYRQDEIIATLDVLEEFNIRIGTLQHILEGYKVADRIAKHGAMVSSFADWWAYKYEVFDAIPYNGVLMHDAGVVVSFNSDDPELARHLNTEAAKAIKYGNVPEQEALKFVTLNPAKQLRIDERIGSIEVGKDADLVIWSGRPLSTTSRCEQTWIDGRMYFSVDSDAKLRGRDKRWRAQLIQLAVGKTKGVGKKGPAKEEDKTESSDSEPKEEPQKEFQLAEEDRWLRYDEYCNARGQQQEAQ